MTFIRSLLLIVALALPAHAADAVYPPGSRIGLAPPAGMTPSQNFSGFEDRAHHVAMVMALLPREAFAEIETATVDAVQEIVARLSGVAVDRAGIEKQVKVELAHG